jgi:hypothetical protein
MFSKKSLSAVLVMSMALAASTAGRSAAIPLWPDGGKGGSVGSFSLLT